MTKPAKKQETPETSTIEIEAPKIGDGRWFQLKRINFSEAELTEVVVKDGAVIESTTELDMSKICLGKLFRRIGETYGEKQ